MQLADFPHRRYNPLSDEWVLVSPQRTKRPWQGQIEKPAAQDSISYDPDCYLCPGNLRAGGVRNPPYKDVFVFENDFSALLSDIPTASWSNDRLLVAESERGVCEVLCFSPRHDLTLPRMSQVEIERIVQLWTERYSALAARPYIAYVQIFENRGAIMGCSNPHPHGQIWATEHLPDLPAREDRAQRTYLAQTGRCLLCDYSAREIELGERLIFRNDSFVALVPFWAVWPYEVMILPLRHLNSLTDFTDQERADFAEALKRMGTRYDNLFLNSFPYSMGFHQIPGPTVDLTDREDSAAWHFHLHYFPPLLRSATIRKFMVGFELLAMPQRDISPESAAETLRSLSEIHYLEAV